MSTPLEQRYRRVLKLLPPYYRLTGGGLEVLDAETDRMEAIASVARARLDRVRPEQARPARPSSRISPRVLGDGAAS
jgi:hypothetical protein